MAVGSSHPYYIQHRCSRFATDFLYFWKDCGICQKVHVFFGCYARGTEPLSG